MILIKKTSNKVILKKIITNISWLLIEKLIKLVTTIAVGLWIARYLGPSQFGQLNYSIAYVALFSAFVSLGLDNIVVKELVRNKKVTDTLLGTTFILKICGFIVTLFILVISLSFIEVAILTKILILIIYFGNIGTFFNVIDLWYQHQVASKLPVYARSASLIICALINIVLILNKANLMYFAIITATELIISSIGFILIYKISQKKINNWKFSSFWAKKLLKDSWPLIISSLAITIYMRIDQIMLGNLYNNEEVGVYSVAVKLAELWYFIPMIFINSWFPVLVAYKERNQEEFIRKVQQIYDLMSLIAYAIAIPVTFIAPYIIKTLYGPEYSAASPVLCLYIWIGLFVNLGVARSSFLNANNWNQYQLISSVSGCIINIVLNLFLIPKYGAVGATVASLFSYWFQTHGICFFIPKLNKTALMLTKSIYSPFRLISIIKGFR